MAAIIQDDRTRFLCERTDLDTAWAIAVSLPHAVHGQIRNAMFIGDDNSKEMVVIKLRALAKWIEEQP